MKSSPLKIFLLILAVVLLLLPLQWLPDITVGSYEVKRVALLSDVLPEPVSVDRKRAFCDYIRPSRGHAAIRPRGQAWAQH